jgi:signal transduction histidine kinase
MSTKRRKLDQLWEISRILMRVDDDGTLVRRVLDLLREALHLHSAIAIMQSEHGLSTIVSHSDRTSEQLEAAQLNLRSKFERLLGSRHNARTPSAQRFVVVPLGERRRIFGALQVEGIQRLDELDLAFTSTVANQLALALDRRAVSRIRQRAVEQRRIEAEQQSSWLQMLLDGLPVGVLILDDRNQLVMANHQARAIWPSPYDETCPLFKCVGPEAIAEREVPFSRQDNTKGTLLVSSTPIRDPGGRMMSGIVTFLDITQRKRSERLHRFLSEAAQTLAEITEHEQTAATITRLPIPEICDACVLHRLTSAGLEIEHAAGLSDGLATRIARRDLEETVHSRVTQLRGDRTLITPLIAHDEVIGTLSFLCAGPDRRFEPYDTALIEEFAHRAATFIENARLHRDTQSAVRSRDELLAVVSHDLRNLVSSVLLSVTALTAAPDHDDRRRSRRHLERIHRSAERMHRLTTDLLDAASIEAGRFTIRARPASAHAIVNDAVEALTPDAMHKSIELRVELPIDLPPVVADATRIVQALCNLLGNGIKFTPPGGRISIAAARDSDFVRFSVSDNGPGISDEDRPRVFDRFWRGGHTRTPGTGLGLSIVSGIVDAHHGKVWFETSHTGTTFHFTLPAETATVEDTVAAAPGD